jgi:hypothetical protein
MVATIPTSLCPPTPYVTPESHQSNGSQRADRTIVPLSRGTTSIGARLMRLILLVCVLFSVANALNWDCPTPKGSYSGSCTIDGSPYSSTDRVLEGFKFCVYTVACKKVGRPASDRRVSKKVLPREDLACGTHWENCDGHLIARSSNSSLCTTKERIQEELRSHFLTSSDQEKQQSGSLNLRDREQPEDDYLILRDQDEL